MWKKIKNILVYSMLIILSVLPVIDFVLFNFFIITWEDLGHWSTYLVGVASIWGVKGGLEEYRKQRKATQIEKSEKALVSARKFVDGILFFTNPYLKSEFHNERATYKDRLSIERTKRWEIIKEDAREYFNANSEADLYLGDNILELFKEIDDIWQEVRIHTSLYFSADFDNFNPSERENTYKKAFGMDQHDRLKEIQAEITEILKSYREKYS